MAALQVVVSDMLWVQELLHLQDLSKAPDIYRCGKVPPFSLEDMHIACDVGASLRNRTNKGPIACSFGVVMWEVGPLFSCSTRCCVHEAVFPLASQTPTCKRSVDLPLTASHNAADVVAGYANCIVPLLLNILEGIGS